MKLKKVTLIALFVFVGFFVALLFVPVDAPTPVVVDNSNVVTPVKTPTKDNTGVVTTPIKTPVSTPVVDNSKVLNSTNVAKHNTANDCYLVVKSSVYDVTNFIGDHPGGRKRIVDMCGKEATAIFSAIHSNFAWNLLKEYYVGPLVKN